MKNIEIRQYVSTDFNQFVYMFGAYLRIDICLDISDEQLKDICLEIVNQIKNRIVFMDILLINNTLVGFIIYQIDSLRSDWCEKEGYGFIRELYIVKNMRRNGLGKKIATYAENKLYQLGVEHIYLTTDNRKDFWINCGYLETEERSSVNHDPIFIK